ncbi:hypothetical protein DL768_011126 [Monosporascus sp. mg162]|nr:hypothetical protein DL768_011126 [Monosporascus sp. mg162]
MRTAIFSQAFIFGSAFAKVLEGATAVQPASLKTSIDSLTTLPEPSITVNESSKYWKGMEWQYQIPHAETGKIAEEFSIHIIDGGFVTEEEVERRSPSELALISANQIAAAAAAIGNDLRADDYAKAKNIVKGLIYQHAVGISTNIISFYITKKFQGQDVRVTDTCSVVDIKDLENTIRHLQADIRDLGSKIQSGDSRPRTYDHYAEEKTRQLDGAHLKHTVKPTHDPNDFNQLLLECPAGGSRVDVDKRAIRMGRAGSDRWRNGNAGRSFMTSGSYRIYFTIYRSIFRDAWHYFNGAIIKPGISQTHRQGSYNIT